MMAKRCFYLDCDFKDIDVERPSEWFDAAVRAMCAAEHLPHPNAIVRSGGGTHYYWALATPVAPGVWKPAAQALHAMAKRHIVWAEEGGDPVCVADVKCTVDVVRVLRAPGTRNHKYTPPMEVTAQIIGDHYEPAHLHALFEARQPGGSAAQVSEAMRSQGVVDATQPREYPPYNIRDIVESGLCPLVVAMDRPEVQQRCSEPLWFDMLCLAANAQDGDLYVHRWSSHHIGYDYAATERKYEHAKSQSPRTCARMADNPLCRSCPRSSGSGSPVSLRPASRTSIGLISTPDTGVVGRFESLGDEFANTLRNLHPGEESNEDVRFPETWPNPYGIDVQRFCMIRFDAPDKDELADDSESQKQVSCTVLCDGVFWPSEKLRNADGEYSVRFWFWPVRTEYPRSEIVPLASISTRSVLESLLARNGFVRSTWRGDHIVDVFMHLTRALVRTAQVTECVSQIGWSKNFSRFFTGTEFLERVPEGIAARHVNMAHVFRPFRLKFGSYGRLEEWKRAANTLCGDGLSVHRMAVVAGFASALMPLAPTGMPHLLHLYSTASGSGKTTAQRIAVSVWGDPAANFGTSNATFRSLLERCSPFGNTCYAVDEITTYSREDYHHLAYQLASGQPRQRLNDRAEYTVRGQPWCFLAITSANRDIAHELRTAGAAHGELARITSVRVHAGLVPVELSQEVEVITQHHGVAGREFVSHLLSVGPDVLREELRHEVNRLGKEYCANAAHRAESRFRLDMCAALVVAARRAVAQRILPEAYRDVEQAVKDILGSELEAYRTAADELRDDLRDFLTVRTDCYERLVRDGDGRLHVVRRIGTTTERASAVTNPSRGTVLARLVLNETLPGADFNAPVLLIAPAVLNAERQKILPHCRTNPVQELRDAFPDPAGAFFPHTVEVSIGGVRMEMVRLVLPASWVDRTETEKALQGIGFTLPQTGS